MNDSKMIDVSDDNTSSKKKRDKFMIGIYVSLVILVVLSLLIYFFGYDVLKPFIKV